ncbi:hypothetical protein [Candidatus Thiosymbion oneisti]|uniref:hypothetical protein n=1 Tax=Candidatus Thiosymbion oneisti TaxID=589554 RepID=UPI00105B2C68|nr:hypothetical protein [Candidatus Thiosymbion oneisti]
MLTLTHQESLAFYCDVAFMRLANRPAQILVDADYDRALLIDLAARSTRTIPFAPAVNEFMIYSWLVAPDGSASYLTSSEPVDFGLRLDHNQGTATRFHFPYESSRLIGPCWQTPPPLQILDSNGQVRTLDSTRGIVYASADVLQQEPAKSYLTLRPQWPPHKGAYRGQGVYVSGRQQTLIGYLPPPLSRQPALLAPQEDASAIDVTHYMDNLFVCYEERVEQHVGETMRTVIEAPSDRYLMGVDVVMVGDQSILCVLCATQDQSAQPSGFIELYRLTPEQRQTTG